MTLTRAYKKHINKITLMFLGMVLSATFLSHSVASAAGVPRGPYSGSITLNTGSKIPVDISIKYVDQEAQGDTTEVLGYKKVVVASFMLNYEGGPYAFSYASFDIETGILDLRYSRPTATNPSLRFFGMRQKDGSFTGHVTSALSVASDGTAQGSGSADSSDSGNDIGTFTISPTAPSKVPKVTPKLLYGVYNGTFTFDNGGEVDKITLKIDSTFSQAQTNPPDFELDFTPGKAAGVTWLDTSGLSYGFNPVYVDYLHNFIRMTSTTTSSTGNWNATYSVTFAGHFNADGSEISGDVIGSNRGKTATFDVRRATK